MFSSHKVIRRFTPPTCTLEICANNSPLSRWTNRNLLKDLQFKLSFDDPRLPPEQQLTIKGDRSQLEQLYEVVINYTQNILQLSSFEVNLDNFLENNQRSEFTNNQNQPGLKPLNLVQHEFFYGALNQQNPDKTIKLSASQLFDLVTALEEYQTEIAVLPQSLNNSQTSKKYLLWGSIAAATILTLGLTTVGVNVYYQAKKSTESQASVQKPESTIINPQINDVIPPKIFESEQKTAVKPKLTEPLSSTEKLPPPPPVDLPKPPPDIPDPAKFTLPELSNLNIPQPSQPIATNQPESQANNPAKPTNLEQQITTQPRSNSIVKLPNQNSPDSSQKTDFSDFNSVANTTNNQNIDEIETDPDSDSRKESRRGILESETTPSLSSPSTEEKLNNTTINSGIVAQTNQTLIPEIPQTKEIKQYFQNKWQAPEGLKQTLEYRLILNPNGTIRRIIPLGKASQIYLDRTNIPLMGETFVSPLKEKRQATIRLMLSPDGEVRTFLEQN